MEINKDEEVIKSLKEDDIILSKTIPSIHKFIAELIGTAFLVFVVSGISIFSVGHNEIYK